MEDFLVARRQDRRPGLGEVRRQRDDLGSVVRFQPAHQFLDMRLDRPFADAEGERNALVGQAAFQPVKHLQLSRRACEFGIAARDREDARVVRREKREVEGGVDYPAGASEPDRLDDPVEGRIAAEIYADTLPKRRRGVGWIDPCPASLRFLSFVPSDR